MNRILQLLFFVSVLVGSFHANAALLTFDLEDACAGTCEDWDLIDQSYGDATGVDVIWGTADSDMIMQYWSDDYSDLMHVGFAGEDSSNSVGEIRIAATGGSVIRLYGFDLGAYSDECDYDDDCGGTDTSWSILDLDGMLLASSGNITVDAMTR
ncbi:MAG: hypothetical protein HRU20_17315 [Pseudomonadales bacterium]|nr:hypothetical protein [Pseudomonadales bacterium]